MSPMTRSIHDQERPSLFTRHFSRRKQDIAFRMLSGLRPLLLVLALLTGSLGSTAWASIVNEPMTGATAPGWVIGGTAFLTASTGVDPVGNGWLRLTDPGNNEAGFAFFDSPFDISQGVVIQFDYATWGGNGADGYSVFLFDGSYNASTFSVGASGGSLGYAQKTVAPIDPGLTGGYIGVGVDEYGNFSNPTEGRIGGPGQQANEVGVRGPYNHPSGAYYWLGGSGTLATQLAFNNQLYRPIQSGVQYRKVVIYLTPVAAPNYLRVDTYVQFGYNQPLTPVVTGLYTGQPVPASVKIGYAASTGGSTNYHEIRNLLIDPLQTDINLVMTKTVSSPTVTAGGPVVYTLTARNNGPYTQGTATNMPISDTLPALLTGATWTCAGANGGTCSAASGSGNINTTATLPFNASVSYTIRSTVVGTAALGSVITNTATLTPPAGITDYLASDNTATVTTTITGPTVTLSGTIYSDANHNGVLDGGEVSPNLATIYAKLFRTADMTTALQAVLYTRATGVYSFSNVPSYDNYTIILSTNNTLTDPTPIDPSANWIYTLPVNYTLSNIAVTNSSIANLNFGLYNGSRISGKVINDNGLNGAPSNANDGVLNAAETGIAGVTVRLTNTTGGTTYDTTTTDSGGNFALYTNTASATLRIYETNLTGYVSVNANAGSTAGAYTMAGEYISFAYTRYANNATGGYTSVVFSDVQDNTFTPTPLGQSNLQTYSVYYGHTFTPNTGGSVSFSTASRSQAGWPALVYYQDVNCNGSYDAGTDIALPASLTASAGTPICLLVKDTIPAGATLGTTDVIVTRATFTFTNSAGPVVSTYNVTDTTTVASPAGSVTVSGTVYSDVNHNGVLDGGETSSNVAGIYAKLFYASNLASAQLVTAVTQTTGAYTFVSVPTNTNYVIILSSTNTTTYDPSFPNAQWVYTSPANYTLAVAVGGANLTSQNFGVFNGTRIDGIVIQDDGGTAGPSSANNGVQNAGEPGISGVTMSICDNASCTATDTETADAGGKYSLFVPWATNFATARVTQTLIPAGDLMVNYNPGNATGSAANPSSRYVTFTFSRGTEIANLLFSDVPGNSFTPATGAQSGAQTASLYYPHTFTPGSGGSVSFAPSLRSQGTWSAVAYYLDTNCNGVYDAGTDTLISGSLTATKGTPICILAKDTILATAPSGTTDTIVTQATFTYTSSYGPLMLTSSVTDTTTVITPNLTTSTKTWTDLSGGPGGTSVYPSDVLQYTITLTSTSTVTALGVQVTDAISANLSNFVVMSIPAGASDYSTATTLDVRNITVPPNGSATIVFISTVAAASGSVTNTANVTLPAGAGPAITATTATIVSLTGNKPLYLYSTGSSPYLLSRTTPTTSAAVPVSTGTGTVVWQEGPVLQSNVTLNNTNPIPVNLNLASSSTGTVNFLLTLACSGGGSTSRQYSSYALTTTVTQYALNVPASTLPCNAGNRYTLSIYVTSARSITVTPINGANYSAVVLPSQNVISVNSINSSIATYPSTTSPAPGYFTGGQTVYVQAVVSDPFGSFDIVTAPTITIKDPSGAFPVSNAAMTIKDDSGAATKTFEYAYTVPAAGPGGTWSITINAKEGTENTVSDTGVGTFRVVLKPSLTMLKVVQTYSDPYNSTTNPKAIPGAVMLYTITTTNSGPGTAQNMTITDTIPANTVMYVGDIAGTGSGPVLFTDGPSLSPAAPASGLSYSFGGLGIGADSIAFSNTGGAPYTYTPVPDANGFDANVKGIQITPSGSFNASDGVNNPAFSLKFRVQIQ